MRWRPFTWLLLSIFFFVAAAFFWQLGDQWAAKKTGVQPSQTNNQTAPEKGTRKLGVQATPFHFLTEPESFKAVSAVQKDKSARRDPFANRLSNTTKTIKELKRSDQAILLQNALISTETRARLSIPDHLRAHGQPGSYIVQSRTPLDDGYRTMLRQAGAEIVSYIPNNAYLVLANGAARQIVAADPQTQAVLPFEPYYKLEPSLLKLAVEQQALPSDTTLNLLLFPGARARTVAEVKKLSGEVIREETSPLGQVLTVRAPATADSLPAIAALTGVQMIERVRGRVAANDLSRATIGIAADSITATNYLGLTGSNILVNVNDTGIDPTHPDFAPNPTARILGDSPASLVDTDGHGTHVAGIIAGSGAASTNVNNALGSIMPAVDKQFRGKAPASRLFSMSFDPVTGPFLSDTYMQETAARTNAFISNNGWNYGGGIAGQSYDIAAASFDAAVRDALPRITGSQPLLYVFSAGNSGNGDDSGENGDEDTVQSPATAKNVITVGGIEQLRNITNVVVVDCTNVTINGTNFLLCQTNTPWAGLTDNADQVASFSSRGNVGVGVEGDSGRFKPDVVAPSTFVISTRSSQWDQNAYYTRHDRTIYRNVTVVPNDLPFSTVFIPVNALQLTIQVLTNASSPFPFPGVPIYIGKNDIPTPAPGGYDFLATNLLTVTGPALAPQGQYWFFAVGNNSGQTLEFDLRVDVTFSKPNDNVTFQVLSNINNSLETNGTTHYYRYESGTSMAAAEASGTLALMQEFLQNRLGHKNAAGQFTNSPALMKALLINGARPIGTYHYEVTNTANIEGWGLINLTNSLHGGLATPEAATNSMFMYDQSPAKALATGQQHTRNFRVSDDGRGQPLRITLVWTDPPGNPIASSKLVNNLDLVVTNLDSGDVFYGNDIPEGAYSTQAWDTNSVPNLDVINNVENIFLPPRLDAHYSVTVIGRRVNVNAVTANPNDVAQDYALVVSSGNGDVTNALSFTGEVDIAPPSQLVTTITNSFGPDNPDNFGAILTQQRVGANSPLIGTNTVPLPTDANAVITVGVTNQWHFYVFTNTATFTNAAFATFAPPNLALPVMGAREGEEGTNAARIEADLDLYVSRDSRLTNLATISLANATKSVSRGGTETIVLTNARPGIYYIGVKSEDQRAAEYSLAAIVSRLPFSDSDANGNVRVRGIPAPARIPDGKPERPGAATIIGFALNPSMRLHRVIVTNTITHELMGDLQGSLTHQGDSSFAVLNNHTIDSAVTNATFIYDDSSEQNVPFAQHTDGPGSLHDFAGKHSGQQWILTMVDNSQSHIGTNVSLFIFLEKQQDLTNGITALLKPGACREDFVGVPGDATSLTVTVGLLVGSGPLSFEVCPLNGAAGQCKSNYITGAGSVITIDRNDVPPLTPGDYVVRLCNLGTSDVTVNILAQIGTGQAVPVQRQFTLTNPVPILDDAVTTITNIITNHFTISSLDVGLLVQHARASDLAITLISPNGTRILLIEDRGAASTTGLGTFTGTTTNSLGIPVFAYTNMLPIYTNSFEAAPAGIYMPGAQPEHWNVLTNSVAVVRDLTDLCLDNNVLVLGDGIISNALPTTNSTVYRLSFNVTHSPYILGMVGWWPFDDDSIDIFGGMDGILCGDPQFTLGEVGNAYVGDGIASSVMVPGCPDLDLGNRPGFTIEGWINPANITNAGPLVEWNVADTNAIIQGVQFWLSGRFTAAGGPGSLSANFWDTNSNPHAVETAPLVITNSPTTNGTAWQHVALTYDAATLTAQIFANGVLVLTQQVSATSFVPRTTGDLYFGYHAGTTPARSLSFKGGLDEFSLYQRALCACEIAAIAGVTNHGKYGTNVLTCPVTNSVQIAGNIITNFVNGTNWNVTGPLWENNVIEFTHPLLAGTNGIGTNLASILISPVGCPGAALDEFVLSALVTNFFDGLLHFTDDTNLAPVPIKFAPTPYTTANFPPTVIFTNGFENATQGVQTLGSTIFGSKNNAFTGQRNWTVTNSVVSVVPTSDGPGVSNAVALAFGAVECTLPTVAGHRYVLSYTVRGPCAAGWWNGDINPASQRARDLIGGNDGAFINQASSSFLRFVGPDSLFLPGMISNSAPGVPDLASKIELGDPVGLQFTNSFSIEGWIRPIAQTNQFIISQIGTDEERMIQQIFFRGDLRTCLDPYYLALEQSSESTFDLLFHVENANSGDCGVTLEAGGDLISVGRWQHIAAVFESNAPWTNNAPYPTNQLRLYVDGVRVTNLNWHPIEPSLVDGYTSARPFRDLDPAYSPGVAIGNRSRGNASEPFRGNIDELSVYSRALTDPEIAAIRATGRSGKFDPTVPPAQSLAKVSVQLDGEQRDIGNGDNSTWTTHTFTFTSLRADQVLRLQSLLPGTEIGQVTLTEIPAELSYQPEEPLSQLNGQDAFGEWRLEIWDNRAGARSNNPQLVDWQLTFHLLPEILPPVISLEHCTPYENVIPANGIQYFTVEVPQWAAFATNVLISAHERFSGNPLPVTVLYNQTNFPGPADLPLIGPVPNGSKVLSTTTNSVPILISGEPYFLAVTNSNPVAVDFTIEVCFDVATLTNCQPATNFVSGVAGIPRYFQFDIPTNFVPDSPPQEVTLWLTGANSNLTVVLSEHLPLPDLAHYDYISARPCTNDEILLVVTNSTPFPVQNNRWYVGVFNNTATNVPFTITACYATNYPAIIPLTNAVPYVADLTNQYVAPPGPPQWFFFEFSVTNDVAAILFELYGLSGDADLVLQKDVPPGQWPYFDASMAQGLTPEQIVVRRSFEFPDLRGNWFLGVYNHETTNVAYTIRAITSTTNGMLISALPLRVTLSPLAPPRGGLLQWNSVIGETYEVQITDTLAPPDWSLVATVIATTTCSTFEFPSGSSGFIRVVQVPPGTVTQPKLKIQLVRPNLVRISWPTSAIGYSLQYASSPTGPWTLLGLPVSVVGTDFVVFDTMGPGPRYYRLIK